MPKLPWKRGEQSGSEPSLSAYLPTQAIDYTSMPVIEEEGKLDAFRRLPAPARIAIIVAPLLLILGGVWAMQGLLVAQPAAVAAKPVPQLVLAEARLVNGMEIAIEGETRNVPDGAKVTAQLLVDEEISNWGDTERSAGEVERGRIKLRMRKASDWQDFFPATSVYSVELSIATDPPVIATQGLIVPERLADTFYGKPVVKQATPEPTSVPQPTSVPEPQPPTLVVGANATMLISPTLGTATIGTPGTGATYTPLMRTPDSQFFLVQEGDVVGWLPLGQVTVQPDDAARVPATPPAAEAVQAGPLKASVGNGGNIRFRPDIKTGTVLGQMHARQTVTLKGRTPDGKWYRVVAPEAEGWASVTLLDIDPGVAAQVPTIQ